VLDIPLKDGDGYDLLRRMDAALGYRPLVVVVTALENHEQHSRHAGVHHHLFKSVNPRVLTDLLDEYAAGLT
jgi:DNA-binding response OmpR family regulator